MTMPNDELLLQRIAAQRDCEAFQVIYDRIGAKAFSLAYYLAGNREKAEEAVQDAMLTVWQKADRFEPARGSAKAWILRIVANNAIHAVRKERSEKRREMTLRVESKGDAAPVQTGEGRHEALLDAVREKFAGLPDGFRQVLALYFAAEMSQAEISQTLAIPQSTISIRIRQGLEELRRQLKDAGYAAALPLVGTKGLGDLLLSGVEVPTELGVRLMLRLGPVAGHSARVVAASKGAAGLWVAAALVTAAVVVGSWWAMKDGKGIENSNRSPAKQVNPILKSEAASPVQGQSPLRNRTWTFKDGIPADLIRLEGKWQTETRPQMNIPVLVMHASPDNKPGLLVLPTPAKDQAFVVTIEKVLTLDEASNSLLVFTDGHSLIQGRNWSDKGEKLSANQMVLSHTMDYWCFDDMVVGLLSGEKVKGSRLMSLSVFRENLKPGFNPMLATNHIVVKSISFREVRREEIPASILDRSGLISELEGKGARPGEQGPTPLLQRHKEILLGVGSQEE